MHERVGFIVFVIILALLIAFLPTGHDGQPPSGTT